MGTSALGMGFFLLKWEWFKFVFICLVIQIMVFTEGEKKVIAESYKWFK